MVSRKSRIAGLAIWAVLVGLGAAYALELVREGRVEGWGAGMYAFHLGLALLLWYILVLIVIQARFGAAIQRPWLQAALYWTPRAAAAVFTLLIGALGLDVFSESGSLWQLALAFLMHSIPALIFLAAIAAAWRWEWVGALLFCGWAVFYVLTAGGFPLSVYVEISGLPFGLGVLYWFNWQKRRQARSAAAAAAGKAPPGQDRSPADE